MLLVVTALACSGCSGGGSGGGAGGAALPAADMQSFNAEDYRKLTDEEKYAISNKLMATLYKGIPVRNFFDLSQNFTVAFAAGNSENYIDRIKSRVSESMSNRDLYLYQVDTKYDFDESQRPVQYPLAMLFEFPLSRDYFDLWMAYKLVNTILFSPAVELETSHYTDAQDIFYRLADMIGDDRSIRDIVNAHMISQENWRRLRSPEDNTREMMEIFLNRFIDEEVPLAAQACKNWALTDESQGYQLIIGYNENTEPLDILDSSLTDCYEFYRAVADHGDLIPTVVATLVDIFFYGSSEEKKKQIQQKIIRTNPVNFRQLFSTIIFSRTYLLETARPMRYEECFFNIAHRIDWYAFRRFFRYINSSYTSSSVPSLKQMNQAPLLYKLGKPPGVPLDTLSFSFYHKSVRQWLLLDRKTDPFSDGDGGWQATFIEVNLDQDGFIDYLFLSVIGRNALQNELDELNAIIESRGYDRDNKKMQQAMIVMDYLSRLSELYYLQSFN